MNTRGANVDEQAVGGDGPVRRARTTRLFAGAVVGLVAALLGVAVAPAAVASTAAASSSGDAGSIRSDARSAPGDAPTTLPGASSDETPAPTPSGPVFTHPSPTASPTTPPSGRPPVRPSIADPGDITTATARFHGTATPTHTVRVTVGGDTTCTAEVAADGTWACLGTVRSGPQQVFTVVDTDAADLGSAATPAADVVTPPTVVSRGASNGTVAGDGHPGATVTLSVAGTSTQSTAQVGADGRWVVSLPRTTRDGSVAVSATQTANTATGYRSDLRSAASAPATLRLDRTAPAAPRVTSPSDGARADRQPVRVVGTGEPSAVVTVYVDRAPVCTTTVRADGSWSCTTTGAPLRPGARALTAVQRDPAGNTSRPSSRTALVVGVASAFPTGDGTAGSATPGSAPGDGATPGATPGTPGAVSPQGPAPSGASTGGAGGSGGDGGDAGPSGAAAAVGGRPGHPDWSGAAGDWSAGTVYDAAVPTIQSVSSWRTVTLATVLAAGFLLLVAAPLALVAGVVRGRVRSPFAALLGRNRPRSGRSRADDAVPTWVSLVASVLVVTVCTLLGSGVQLEARYVRLAAAVAIGSALMTAAVVLATRWAAGSERSLVGFRVSPWLVLAALLACAATRAADLSPALVVGVVLVPTGRVDLGTGPMRLGASVACRARSATWRTAVLLALAVAGWVVHSLLTRGGVWPSLVSDVAITLCVGGLGAAVATLLPSPGSVGAALLSGSRGRFAALALVTGALAAAVYSGSTGTHLPPAALVSTAAVCVAAALTAWVWSRTDAARP